MFLHNGSYARNVYLKSLLSAVIALYVGCGSRYHLWLCVRV